MPAKTPLTQTLELSAEQIEVLRNQMREIENEEPGAKARKRRSIWSIFSPARIAIYGFVGYSIFSYISIVDTNYYTLGQQFEEQFEEQYVEPSDGLWRKIREVRSVLSGPYERFYKEHQGFPTSTNALRPAYGIPVFLNSVPIARNHYSHSDGRITLRLKKTYGTNSWLQLTPKVVSRGREIGIDFDCLSNAKEQFLADNGKHWCKFSSSQMPPI